MLIRAAVYNNFVIQLKKQLLLKLSNNYLECENSWLLFEQLYGFHYGNDYTQKFCYYVSIQDDIV